MELVFLRAEITSGLRLMGVLFCLELAHAAAAQPDTLRLQVTLDEVVISAKAQGFDVDAFIRQVQEDTTFHKAFLNTRFHQNRVRSGLRVHNKGEKETASIQRTARLLRLGQQAVMEMDSSVERGRLRGREGGRRYLTVEMYDDVFFPQGVFRANNTVAARRLEVDRGSRFEKYKSELKKFMFDPGTEITSVPFIGHKLALFSPEIARFYVFRVWSDEKSGRPCWVFSADARPEFRDGRTVIKTMDTWFDQDSGVVLAREYRIANSSVFLDFDITIRVQNAVVDGEPVPVRVDYDGDWDIPFRGREIVRFWLVYDKWQVVR